MNALKKTIIRGGLETLYFSGANVVMRPFVRGVGAILTLPTVLLFIVFFLLNFFSVFTMVSIIGVILGVAALVVVSSVTSGFQRSFR